MPRDRDDAATRAELQRGERFLAAYNLIEQSLRRKWGDPGGKEGFRRLVDVLSERDWTVRKFKEDLVEFGELRNAIVHDRISPTYLIAAPLAETVERIEQIAAAVERPPLVFPQFKRDVVCFGPEDRLESVLRAVAATGYTQFPVYDGPVYQGLLTDGGIARWLASRVTRGTGSGGETSGLSALGETQVSEVLTREKNPDRARFIPRSATVYEAEHVFAWSGKSDKWRVAALLITENGVAEEKLLGIVTPSDILACTRQ
jgi:CBS domain-containing protein